MCVYLMDMATTTHKEPAMTYEELIIKGAEQAVKIQTAMQDRRWRQQMTNDYEGIVIDIMRLVNATGERASRRIIEQHIDAAAAAIA